MNIIKAQLWCYMNLSPNISSGLPLLRRDSSNFLAWQVKALQYLTPTHSWDFLLRLPQGFPGGVSGKEFTCQCRRCEFSPWAEKLPWRRKWEPPSEFLHGKSHGQEPSGLQSMGLQRVRRNWAHTHIQREREREITQMPTNWLMDKENLVMSIQNNI